MRQDSRPIYSIGAVARLLGVTPGTLRTWEDRYRVVSPKRSTGGRRLYSRDEVEGLRFVKMRIDEGIQPADAHRLLAERAGGSFGLADETAEGGPHPLIMLVERDPYAADFMEHFLRREGYEVDVAFDVADAERRWSGLVAQLAIIELLLSGGDGADLCRRLKERRAAPVLAVSTLDARNAALAAGADAFLQKPIDPLVLVSTVKDLLGSNAVIESNVAAPA